MEGLAIFTLFYPLVTDWITFDVKMLSDVYLDVFKSITMLPTINDGHICRKKNCG